MVEIELKFQLPTSKKRAVLQRLKKEHAHQIQLQAKYYDTPDHILAKNNMAIRLRQEGETWVQTFKAATSSHMQRIEDEVDLGTAEPELDLSLYQQKPQIQTLLQQALAQTTEPLQLQFQTNVQRHYQHMTVGDSIIEVCLDDGEVSSPQGKAHICEVEFELKQGSASHLIELAKQWVTQYGLWLDVRSKAERGSLLAAGQTVSPATTAKPLKLSGDLSAEQALQCIVSNGLNQLLPNAAAIAGDVAQAEHIHQARIALRRLRSAFKHLGKWSDHVDQQWAAQLSALFKTLGTTRDIDVVKNEILPQLVAIGAPALTLNHEQCDQQPLAPLFTCNATVHLFLDLLDFVHRDSATIAPKRGLPQKFEKILQHLHAQLIAEAKTYASVDIETRHQIRKQVKQLRYISEFVASIYNKKAVKHYLSQLQQLQNCLGTYHDMVMAQHVFEQQVAHDAQFWFALGWNSAQQQHLLIDAERAMQQFAKSKTFW